MGEMKSSKVPNNWTLKLAAVDTARHQCALYKCTVCCQSGNTLTINKAPVIMCAYLKFCNFFAWLNNLISATNKKQTLRLAMLYVDLSERNFCRMNDI